MQISPGADRGHAAAAENGLALVVSGVAHQRAEDGQPAVEVAQTAVHQHAVLTPRDAQLDERPAGWGGVESKEFQISSHLKWFQSLFLSQSVHPSFLIYSE